MSAKVLGAAEDNVAEHLYTCSFLGLLLTLLALRDVIQGNAIAPKGCSRRRGTHAHHVLHVGHLRLRLSSFLKHLQHLLVFLGWHACVIC